MKTFKAAFQKALLNQGFTKVQKSGLTLYRKDGVRRDMPQAVVAAVRREREQA